jgi:hypothetical protein
METIVRILQHLHVLWLNAHWLVVMGVVFANIVAANAGYQGSAIYIAALLWYFVVFTWPYRWVIDAFIILCALQAFAEWLGAVWLHQWIHHI